MMTLKTTILAMMISASALSLTSDQYNSTIEYPNPQRAADYFIIHTIQPAAIDGATQKSAAYAINKDKTYEQCEKEAFEIVYSEVNKMLANTAYHSGDRF